MAKYAELLKGCMMLFHVFLSLWVLNAVCTYIRSVSLPKIKVSNPNRYSFKSKTLPRPLKRLIQTAPTCLHHDVRRFALPKCLRKEGGTIILAVVLLLMPHVVEMLFRCESESTLFGRPNEYTTRNQWLSCIYNTVPEQYQCKYSSVCSAFYRGLFPET